MPVVLHECPGCGEPVLESEDYVITREFRREEVLAHGFGHPRASDARAAGVERRFHGKPFRGRIGDYIYGACPRVSRNRGGSTAAPTTRPHSWYREGLSVQPESG